MGECWGITLGGLSSYIKWVMFTHILESRGEYHLKVLLPVSGWTRVRPGMCRPFPFRSYLLPLQQFFACPNVLNQYIFDCYASPPTVGLWRNTDRNYLPLGWFISRRHQICQIDSCRLKI